MGRLGASLFIVARLKQVLIACVTILLQELLVLGGWVGGEGGSGRSFGSVMYLFVDVTSKPLNPQP